MGVDFKIQESTGQWFFLETNSMPCYEGYDRRAGGAICRGIVKWLTATTPQHSWKGARESADSALLS